jgi:hypothetical protein
MCPRHQDIPKSKPPYTAASFVGVEGILTAPMGRGPDHGDAFSRQYITTVLSVYLPNLSATTSAIVPIVH